MTDSKNREEYVDWNCRVVSYSKLFSSLLFCSRSRSFETKMLMTLSHLSGGEDISCGVCVFALGNTHLYISHWGLFCLVMFAIMTASSDATFSALRALALFSQRRPCPQPLVLFVCFFCDFSGWGVLKSPVQPLPQVVVSCLNPPLRIFGEYNFLIEELPANADQLLSSCRGLLRFGMLSTASPPATADNSSVMDVIIF